MGRFESYVTNISATFGSDPRVRWLEIFNEPNVSDPFSVRGRCLLLVDLRARH